MKIFFLLTASTLSALSLVSAQFSIPLHRDAREGNVNGSALIDWEAKRVTAKYAKHAEVHFKHTGEHLGVVNDTTLGRRSDSGEVKLNMLDASNWVGEIEVGTPGQKQSVIFDSGSPELVIGRGSYKPENSITSKNQHKKFDEKYAGLEAKVSLFSDEVKVGGVTAKNVTLGETESNFLGRPDDQNLVGIFGLSFPFADEFGTNKKHRFIELAKEQNPNFDNVFQVLLRNNDDARIHVGKVDETSVDGDNVWVDVESSDEYWKAGVEINGIKASGIIDSGTTHIFGRNDDVKKILDTIDGVELKKSELGNWQGWYKCDDPPEVKLKIAGMEVTMSDDAIIGGREGDQCQVCIAGTQLFDMWIFGDPFFQMFSVIFDFDNERMGFGKLKY